MEGKYFQDLDKQKLTTQAQLMHKTDQLRS